MDVENVEPALLHLMKSCTSPCHSSCTSAADFQSEKSEGEDDKEANLQDWMAIANSYELKLKKYNAKLNEQRNLTDYLNKLNDTKNSFLKELTYKLHQISDK